jgi:hypothetical protein
MASEIETFESSAARLFVRFVFNLIDAAILWFAWNNIIGPDLGLPPLGFLASLMICLVLLSVCGSAIKLEKIRG